MGWDWGRRGLTARPSPALPWQTGGSFLGGGVVGVDAGGPLGLGTPGVKIKKTKKTKKQASTIRVGGSVVVVGGWWWRWVGGSRTMAGQFQLQVHAKAHYGYTDFSDLKWSTMVRSPPPPPPPALPLRPPRACASLFSWSMTHPMTSWAREPGLISLSVSPSPHLPPSRARSLSLSPYRHSLRQADLSHQSQTSSLEVGAKVVFAEDFDATEMKLLELSPEVTVPIPPARPLNPPPPPRSRSPPSTPSPRGMPPSPLWIRISSAGSLHVVEDRRVLHQ